MENYIIDLKASAPSLFVTLISIALWAMITMLGMLYFQELIPDENIASLGVIIWAMGMLTMSRFIIAPQIIMREVEE